MQPQNRILEHSNGAVRCAGYYHIVFLINKIQKICRQFKNFPFIPSYMYIKNKIQNLILFPANVRSQDPDNKIKRDSFQIKDLT